MKKAARDEMEDMLETLSELVELVSAARWLVARCVLGALLAGGVYLLAAKPVYQSDILIQIENTTDTTAFRSLLGDIASLFDVRSTAAAEAQIVASRLVLARAVDELALYIEAQPLRVPLVGDWFARYQSGLTTPGLFGMGGYGWGGERIRVACFEVPRELLGRAFMLTVLGHGRYRIDGDGLGDGVSGGRVGKPLRLPFGAGSFTLRVDELAARPGAVFVLKRHSRQRTIDTLRRALVVQERIKQSDVIVASLRGSNPERVARTLNAIGSQYVQQSIERRSMDAATSLGFLEAKLPALKTRLTESETRLTALRGARSTVDLAEESRLALEMLADYGKFAIELEQKREALLPAFTEAHPAVRAIDRQLAGLSTRRHAAERALRRLPDLQQAVVRLMLDVKVNTDLYTALLNNMQQLQLVQASNSGKARLVDAAVAAELPIGPRRGLVLVVAGVLGLVAGCGVALGRALLVHGVDSPGAIERAAGAALIASIPFDARSHAPSAAVELRGGGFEESLHALDMALRTPLRRVRAPIVLLVATRSGDGCVFVAAHLAASAAAARRRVLLIDGDAEGAHLTMRLGGRRGAGLSGWLASPPGSVSPLASGLLDGVALMPAAIEAQRMAGLVDNEQAVARIEALAREYDLVVVTAPAVLESADVGAFAMLSAIRLLVVRAAATKPAAVVEATQRLLRYGMSIDGVVRNGKPEHVR
ncbi:GNVR domain-containing protein [Burkholderia sp. A1]|uniref:GNVR domain-containing protein n=1 Tax=Burkholderia sp. A1 TaxID=148446 RepID=UPI00046AC7FB|nr:GNVR domain-containing protein [Burkholderia sp. A1]